MNRREREEHRQRERRKWARASEIRSRWTEEDFEAEEARLQAEIVALVVKRGRNVFPVLTTIKQTSY